MWFARYGVWSDCADLSIDRVDHGCGHAVEQNACVADRGGERLPVLG